MTVTKSDFRALGLKLQANSHFISYILVKQHVNATSHSSIFVAGLPYNITEDTLRNVFGCFGTTDAVQLHPSHKSALILYTSSDAVSKVMEAAADGTIIEYEVPDSLSACGLKSWVQQHKAKHPGNAVLQKELDSWMEAHEEEEIRKQKEREEAMAEDGWTVVVRTKGRKRAREEGGVAAVSGGVAVGAANAAAAAAGKKGQQYQDFYRFQKREKRRDELMDLRKKFEEDRRRIQELRAGRHFKPC